MSDQDHGGDGTTKISSANTGTKSGHADPDAATVTNVLPFPRDWFGPIEALEPVDLDPPISSPVDAAAFWDADAGAIHQLVDHPDGEAPSTEALAPARERSRTRRLARIVLGLIVLLAVGSALALTGGALHHRAPVSAPAQSQRRHKSVSHSPAPQVTVTATVTTAQTTTRAAVTRRHRKAARRSVAVKAAASDKPEQADSAQTAVSVTHHQSQTQTPVVKSSVGWVRSGSSGSSGSSAQSGGSGCVQSPDSGCLP
jgi:uncharacterized membrane protein YgcG